jgi:hypothetical protein
MSTPSQPSEPPGQGSPRQPKFLDSLDPLTWETPSVITPRMRLAAGLVLLMMAVLMFYVPAKIMGWL